MKLRHARTKSIKADDDSVGCVVCGDETHRKRLYFCKQFKALTLAERRAVVKEVGSCIVWKYMMASHTANLTICAGIKVAGMRTIQSTTIIYAQVLKLRKATKPRERAKLVQMKTE